MKKWNEYQRAIEENFLIVDKNKQEVPFILKPAQQHFLEHSTDRNVILKSRKMGFSSVILAVALTKFLFGKNERCISMSFDKDASGKQLERVKRFLRSYEQINGVQVTKHLKYANKYELVLEVETEEGNYTNTLRVGTARSTGFGRGDDVTFLHLTEVSLAQDIDALLAGVGEAVVNDAMITLETTANGYNEFKTFWDEASAGQRGYKTFFYDPFWEYTKEYVEQRRKELGRLGQQEYPLTPQEAFLVSGMTYFDNEALQAYLKRVREPKEVIRC